jgi:hypothetical protein
MIHDTVSTTGKTNPRVVDITGKRKQQKKDQPNKLQHATEKKRKKASSSFSNDVKRNSYLSVMMGGKHTRNLLKKNKKQLADDDDEEEPIQVITHIRRLALRVAILVISCYVYQGVQMLHREYCSRNLLSAMLFGSSDICVHMDHVLRVITHSCSWILRSAAFWILHAVYTTITSSSRLFLSGRGRGRGRGRCGRLHATAAALSATRPREGRGGGGGGFGLLDDGFRSFPGSGTTVADAVPSPFQTT